ncbi:unnamed protein product [Haemonchus placei]|uniref:Non-specific serine/threonine protein kinase n=1 Tax=Haemonchus placei TaxID=6290 RepID=A0A0N4W257_HAEPC|nr:unnamed protein product [Haemonchus placei]
MRVVAREGKELSCFVVISSENIQMHTIVFKDVISAWCNFRGSRPVPSNSKVTGTLLTHLHEHTDKITQFLRLFQVRLPKLEGAPEQIHVSNNVAYLRSHHGAIYCLDLRVGKTNGPLGFHEVWRREVVKYHGLVTSFVVDPIMENWMVMCSTNNELMLWDLRFQVEVNAWKTPHGLLPLRLWSNPLSSPYIQTPPEVNLAILIHINTNVFFIQDDLRNVTTALNVCMDTGFVYTGDTEGSLRRWNLNRAPLCEYISGPREITGTSYNGFQPLAIGCYKSCKFKKISQKMQVHLQNYASTRHRTSISDVLCLQSDILVSAGSDGVIKIWK